MSSRYGLPSLPTEARVAWTKSPDVNQAHSVGHLFLQADANSLRAPVRPISLTSLLSSRSSLRLKHTVFFLLLGQPGELGVECMIGRQKRLHAMDDRWIRAGGVIEAVDLEGAERQLDAAN